MSAQSLFVTDTLLMQEGDGAEVLRLFPIPRRMMNYDPFVLWDHFTIEPGNGFPTHPHRGFEAITYMFSGSMEHKDNLGNQSTVTAGGAQRFTAGRGIEHSEMPSSQGESSGIQLWINLPQRLKQIEPGYQQVDSESIPVQQVDDAKVRIIVGESSPLQIKTDIRYYDVQLPAAGQYVESVPGGFRGLVYVMRGAIEVNGQSLEEGQALFFETLSELAVKGQQDSRFMLVMGRPHGEPIQQRGPFVD
ncbi:MAG: pirin family protein [Thiohalophilus sp.]|uniref:pirin family protein n=1 Tax=Thiohalophilus sp. TaxID=3028392 RepID=UPI00286FB789|nr:pirin family protein [Thiohalophilus sp.]MDR9435603.1 pirin family protein [Thiohalophilus sp.]